MILSLPQSAGPLGRGSAFVATRNACKLCTPLGACLAFSGVEGCVPLLHGSQGCSTYIRRYMISHFREPIDVASSNFAESSAVFGGRDNLHAAIDNLIRGYRPAMIGIATTCLAETIGEDVGMLLHEYRAARAGGDAGPPPLMVHVQTPSYQGTHAEGYVRTLRAIVEQVVEPGQPDGRRADTVNLICGMLSPADLRYLRVMVESFGLRPILLPDYSERLDGTTWDQYQELPSGGTTIADIRSMGRSAATIEMGLFGQSAAGGSTAAATESAGHWLREHCGVPLHRIGLPIGVEGSDALCAALATVSGRELPSALARERGRLIDSYIDAHKYVFGKRAVVFGEEDLVVALVAMLREIGVTPVLAASGGRSGRLAASIAQRPGERGEPCEAAEDADFEAIADRARELRPDLLIGHSKGFKLARSLDVPLVRVGFPIHDRMGGARVLHVGYAGAQQLFDRIVNELLEARQDESEVEFTYF